MENNLLIALLITSISFSVLSSIIIVVILVKLNVMRSTVKEIANVVYFIMKHQKNNDDKYNDTFDELLDVCCENNDKLSTLSTGISTVVESYIDNKEKPKYIQPMPQLAEMIDKTIWEHINIELALTEHQNLVSKDLITVIIKDTCETYPHVSIDYITKKTFAVVEQMKIRHSKT